MTAYNPLQLLQLPPEAIDPHPIPTALAIDPYADLLWTGSSGGIVSAWNGPTHLAPNVHFPAHGAGDSPFHRTPDYVPGVTEIRATDREIWTLTAGGIGGRKRGGMVKWSIARDPSKSLRSMSPNPLNSHEVIAGGTNGIMLVNTSRGEVLRKVDSNPIVHLAPLPRAIAAAHGSGSISILDPRTGYKATSSVQAHTGGLNGADASGHVLCSWGWTHMQGHPMPDPFVRLFDVRTLRPLPPISFNAGAAFVCLHPNEPQVLIASQQGMLQVYDMSGAASGSVTQLDVTSYLTSMALSPLGDYLAFGDADAQVHIWTSHDTQSVENLPPFNGYEGVKPDWPDSVDPPTDIAWTDHTPLNLIGMPYYKDPLLSNFSPVDYAPVTSPFFNPPEPIPASVMNSIRMVDYVGYATLPKELRGKRYVVEARPGAGKYATGKGFMGQRKDSTPRFRSEKDRRKKSTTDIHEDEETPPGEIPKYYRKVEIKYSKFGIEDFDFDFYNRTPYSGLESDILNSYTNALLQALHYTMPIRHIATGHICVDCKKEHCLLCEAGFLFRMLEDAKGINCQASNFSRAFSATPQASALGLMDEGEKSTAPYGSLIQNMNRWLLTTLSAESNNHAELFALRPPTIESLAIESPSPIDQVLGIQTNTTNTCQKCGFVASRKANLHTIDLEYSRTGPPKTFAETLRSSIVRSATNRATCVNCREFNLLDSRRVLATESLPPVLSLNAMVSNPALFEMWRDDKDGNHFLPPSIHLRPTAEGDIATEGEDGVQYDVQAIVVQVQETPELPAHLLSFVRPPPGDETDGSWILFNDFSVRMVKESEVFSFRDQWKVPAVILLARSDWQSTLDYSKIPKDISPSVLYEHVSLSNPRHAPLTHVNLTPAELPSAGTLIAIDAEFVALQQEELEFRSDGTKKTLRPSHMSLARVSVLRGEGTSEGVPFIDDYIHTKETVVDYLTEFSGIKSGDLDPGNSKHTLVPLKTAYKKLRLLVDLGCTFIGHGLSKDFRTINIFVPPEQVLDTVNLYTIPGRQRKLSLRFLSWFLLKKDIQQVTHDSIEDAKYALLLYKLYQEFESDGRFEDVMEDIFAEGQKVGFKPPQDRTASPAPPPLSAGGVSPVMLPPVPVGPRVGVGGGHGRHLQPPSNGGRSMGGGHYGGQHQHQPRRRHAS